MEKRVKFDFKFQFTNGGSITGTDFRVDVQQEEISDKELIDYVIADLNLLMVGKAKIFNKTIFVEAHKRATKKAETKRQRLIDLSHTIEAGLVTYKGLPAPIVCDYLSRADSAGFYEAGTTFQIGKIEMVANTGTYVDCPFHRFEDGKDLSEVALERFANLEAVTISVPYADSMAITVAHLENYEIRNRAVLLHTGWATHWNTDLYYENHPYLTAEAATYLKDCGVLLVGIDSHNIDNTATNARPAHTILLGAEILIVEHMCNLEALPPDGYWFSAVPPKFKGVGTFPVRAMAMIMS